MGLSRTPFHSRHVAAGARMVPFAGWEMPVSYTGLREEHLAVRQRVGLFDVSHMGEVRVHGPRALAALDWLVTNRIAALVDGQACYGALCNDAGGIVDDVFVYRRAADDLIVVVNAANREKDLGWMRRRNPYPTEAVVTDVSPRWALLAVQGPAAEETLEPIVDADLSDLAARHFVTTTVAGLENCLVSRTGYTGEDGFEVYAPWAEAGPLWDAILEAGAPQGILPCGLGARDTLRLEVRNPLYGHELTEETSPFQAGLAFVVALDKRAGFLGADALRARKGKESHRLVGIVLEGKRIPREGMAVLHDGQEVGHVTSGTRSPSLDKGICLAYVERHLYPPGTRLQIDVRGRIAEGEVVRGPFYTRP